MKEFLSNPFLIAGLLLIIIIAVILIYKKPIKDFFTNSAFKTVAVVTLFAVISIFITFNWLIELSAFAVGIAKGALGLLLVWVFDKYAMKEINTVDELKERNIAYAIFFLGLCIVVAAAIINS